MFESSLHYPGRDDRDFSTTARTTHDTRATTPRVRNEASDANKASSRVATSVGARYSTMTGKRPRGGTSWWLR